MLTTSPIQEATAKLVSGVRLAANDRLALRYSPKHNAFAVRTYAELPTGQVPPSLAGRSRWLSRIPGVQTLQHLVLLEATDTTCVLTLEMWGRDRIVWYDDETRNVFDSLLDRFGYGVDDARVRIEFADHGVVPEPPLGWIERSDADLMPHQKVACYTAFQKDRAAFFLDRGTGKTCAAITLATNEARVEDGIYPILVVCPKSVLHNWVNEFEKFSVAIGDVVALNGSAIARERQVLEALTPRPGKEFGAVVATYDVIPRNPGIFKFVRWGRIILDESHMIRGHTSARSKALVELRETSRRRLLLSGTWIANGPFDLWPQLEFLDEGFSGFTSAKAFKSFYGQFEEVENKDGQRREQLVGFQHLPVLQERIARVATIALKEDVMPWLPERSDIVLDVELSAEQRTAYEAMRDDLLTSFQGREMSVDHALTAMLRLAQITSGYIVADEQRDEDNEVVVGKEVVRFSENPKIDVLIDSIKDQHPKSKAIVWAAFLPVLDMVCERLETEGIRYLRLDGGTPQSRRQEIEDEFNSYEGPIVFVGNPEAGGTGINLPGYLPENEEAHAYNADEVYYVALRWSPVVYQQSRDRNHGKSRCRVPIRYNHLVVPNSIDARILKTHQTKQKIAVQMADVASILREIAL